MGWLLLTGVVNSYVWVMVPMGHQLSTAVALMATITAFGGQPTFAQTAPPQPASEQAADQGCVIPGVWPAANAVVPAHTQLDVKAWVTCPPGDGVLELTVDGKVIKGITSTDEGMQVRLNGLPPGTHTLGVKAQDGKTREWPVLASGQKVLRHSGGNRAATAVAVANQLVSGWRKDWADAPRAIVVNGDREADAISATTLAHYLQAPILVVNSDGVPEDTKTWLSKYPGISISAVGGEGVLSQAVLDELTADGAQVVRVGGDSRYTTAAAVVEALLGVAGIKKAVLADANRWTDALPAAVYAARTGAVLLLTDAETATPASKALVDAHPDFKDNLVVTGSTITDEVAATFSGEDSFTRIDETVEVPLSPTKAGGNKPATGALSVALAGIPTQDSKNSLVFASISNPVDAITAGTLAAKTDGLILADTAGAGVMTRYIQETRKLETQTVHVVGGPSAVSEATLAEMLGAGVDVSRPSQLAMPAGEVKDGTITFTWDRSINQGDIQVNDATGKEIPGTSTTDGATLSWTPKPNTPATNPVMATVRVSNGKVVRHTATVGSLTEPIKDKNGWDVAPGTGPVIGDSGRLYTWVAAVEPETGWSISDWQGWTEKVLNDPRGWTHDGKVRLQRIDDPVKADIRIVLATPNTVDRECAKVGLNTFGKLSCWNNANAMVNLYRMNNGVDHMPDLETYRTYVISHEFGHGLGHGHITTPCADPNQLAPVMMQQSKDLRGCKANGWPFPEAKK